jgi:hypothetical protein
MTLNLFPLEIGINMIILQSLNKEKMLSSESFDLHGQGGGDQFLIEACLKIALNFGWEEGKGISEPTWSIIWTPTEKLFEEIAEIWNGLDIL